MLLLHKFSSNYALFFKWVSPWLLSSIASDWLGYALRILRLRLRQRTIIIDWPCLLHAPMKKEMAASVIHNSHSCFIGFGRGLEHWQVGPILRFPIVLFCISWPFQATAHILSLPEDLSFSHPRFFHKKLYSQSLPFANLFAW